jgi:hypothetical protein
MDYEALYAVLRDALSRIDHMRFFESELGFQGELRAQLERLNLRALLPEGSIIEQEHQKTLQAHRMTIRPDIIIHEPFDPRRHADRTQGNVAVIELKLRASEAKAAGDFESLGQMLDVLHYPVGIFINIGSPRTHSILVPGALRGRIVCYAVWLQDGKTQLVEQRTVEK